MDFFQQNIKKIVATIIVVVLVFIFLVSIFNTLENNTEVLGSEDNKVEEQINVITSPTNEQFNYDFEVTTSNNTQETDEAKSIIKDIKPVKKYKDTLIIPKLNVKTKIVKGTDGEAAINQGAWLYPSSYESDGEKVLLGHRRYWGADDPRSFWNLNQLKKGDEIKYYDQDGRELTYEVRAVGIRTGDDRSILRASKDNVLKVISCSTADGSAGSSEKRIVVIAELQ